MTLVMSIALVVLLVAAVPVAHALLISTLVAIWASGQVSLLLAPQQMQQAAGSFPLIAIPFFILAGTLMMSGKMGKHLIAFAAYLVAPFHGGLAQVSVIGATVFGGVSGSAVASASALGSTMIPWQRREGYPPAFCAALNSSAATIDLMIPPSIPMILYALVSNESIGALFLAGILPGLIMTAGFLVICNVIARRRGFPRSRIEVDRRAFLRSTFFAVPALLLPFLIVIFLRFGVVTPTEVSVVAVAYALLVSGFIYRDLTWEKFSTAMVDAGVTTGVVMLVLMASGPLGWIMTYDRIHILFTEWATTVLQQKWLIILAMNVIMLLIGTFLDLPPAMILLGPVFVPLAQSIGLDTLQLGIMMVLNLAIGLYTPPVGATLFVSTAIAGVPMGAAIRDLMPFFLFSVGLLLLISYVPALTVRF
jgi:tripartite ATP-independent transporter DctM subunit